MALSAIRQEERTESPQFAWPAHYKVEEAGHAWI